MSELKTAALESRYFQPGETSWEDVCMRVARAISNNKTEEEHFYKMMVEKDFLPNSPTLMNAGTRIGQLSACFVIPVEDSMEGIFDAVKWGAVIHKSGGGTGYSFSKLRPVGSPVGSTRGIASGAVSFMTVFDSATEQVKQGGKRRGANMGILDVTHPEIHRFIQCKRKEGILSNFNISAMVPDWFMQNITEKPSDHKEDVELFNEIVEGEWQNGEPSVLFYDAINRANPVPKLGNIEATNPCITGDMLVHTVYGEIPIKDLLDKEIDVFCVDEETGKLKISRAFNVCKTRENAELVEVVTTRRTLKCTSDHLFLTKNRGWIPAGDLTKDDRIIGINRCAKNEKYIRIGTTGGRYYNEHRLVASHYYDLKPSDDVHHIDGDTKNNIPDNLEVISHGVHSIISNVGHPAYCERNPVDGRYVPCKTKKEYPSNIIAHNKIGVNLRVKCVNKLDHREDVYDLTVDKYHNFFANGILISNCGEQPLLPFESCWDGDTRIVTAQGIFKISDLEGMFLGDETFEIKNNISGSSYKSTIYALSYDGSQLLYNKIKNARKTRENAENVSIKLKSGTILKCTPDHKLYGVNGDQIEAKDIVVGDTLLTCYRQKHEYGSDYRITNMKRSEMVVEIEKGEPTDVYNIEVEDTHNYFVYASSDSYILSANCNLGSINLSRFVIPYPDNPDTMCIDWDRLKEIVIHSVHFLNNVIDNNKYPLPQIEQQTKLTRKIGLGVMGFHDMLLKMGIPYDDPRAIYIGEEIMEFINNVAHDESHQMALEQWNIFPAYKDSIFAEKDIPMRNAALTCVAPTGTIAILADCSWSIEPVTSWVYMRKNLGKEFKMIHPIFDEELKKILKECGFDEEKSKQKYNEVVEYCYKYGSIQDILWLPEEFRKLFKSGLEIPWKTQVQMVAAFQKHVDAAISKTINLPEQATREDIRNAIIMAWKLGCKGVTQYRQGSRDEEVVSISRAPKKEPENVVIVEEKDERFPDERPEQLFGVTYCNMSGCGKIYTTINYYNGKPYEVFAFSGGNGGCQAQNEAVGRMASLSLRNNIDFRQVVKQLKKVKCPVAIKNVKSQGKSCSDIIGQLISRSMGDDIEILDKIQKTEKTIDKEPIKQKPVETSVCPDCGAILDFGEGCNKGTCRSCGWSGCS
jgi:ribonucleotide reductase alpha subunit